jgi:hypothetical protein
VCFVAACFAFLCLASPITEFRYLSPLLPFGALLAALIAEAAWRRRAWLGVLVLALWVFSFPLDDYLYELSHPYVGPMGGIVNYLRPRLRPSDLVVISYGDMPLKFYLGVKVLSDDMTDNLPLLRNADWIILRKHERKNNSIILGNIDTSLYRPVYLDGVPDIPFENREAPDLHHYRTVQGESPVMILQRIKR